MGTCILVELLTSLESKNTDGTTEKEEDVCPLGKDVIPRAEDADETEVLKRAVAMAIEEAIIEGQSIAQIPCKKIMHQAKGPDENLKGMTTLSYRSPIAESIDFSNETTQADQVKFQYSPLPPVNNTIRVLRIHSAESFNDPLICDLHQVSLDDKPEYAALSYT